MTGWVLTLEQGKGDKEERVLETCNELTLPSFLLGLLCGVELGVKFSLQEREKCREGVFRFVLLIILICLIDSKMHSLPDAESVLAMTVIGK